MTEKCKACDGTGHLMDQCGKSSMVKCGGAALPLSSGREGVYYVDSKGREMGLKTIGGDCSVCKGSGTVSNFEQLCKDPNYGWWDALDLMTKRLKDGVPQCLVRYGDGEYYSIFGRKGPNADGQEMGGNLGCELTDTLMSIAVTEDPNVLVGSDWRTPKGAEQFLLTSTWAQRVNWCPVQPFVMGIEGCKTLEFLKVLEWRRLYMVCNGELEPVARGLNADSVYVSSSRAYQDMPRVLELLTLALEAGDVVLWCAGLGSKPSIYTAYRENSGTTHIDMGCFFDLAVGKQSRTWMTEPPDKRGQLYREIYVPYLLGEK